MARPLLCLHTWPFQASFQQIQTAEGGSRGCWRLGREIIAHSHWWSERDRLMIFSLVW